MAAESRIVPPGDFPAAMRSAGRSIPWLTALRTRCSTGSANALDEQLVDLGILAGQPDLDLRAAVAHEIADDEWHAPEDLGHRDHADTHDSVADAPQLALEPFAVIHEQAPVTRRNRWLDPLQHVLEPRARDHHVAHVAHQVVEPRQIDPDEGGLRARRVVLELGRRHVGGGAFECGGRRRLVRDAIVAPAVECLLVRGRDDEIEGDAAGVEHAGRGALHFADRTEPLADRVHFDAARHERRRRREGHRPSRAVRIGLGPAPRAWRLGRRTATGDACQPVEGGADRGRRAAAPPRLEDELEGAGAIDERVQPLWGERRLLRAQDPEIALHLVGQPLALPHLGDRRDALERVEVAEQFVQKSDRRVPAAEPAVEREQAGAHLDQVLLALGKVVGHEACDELLVLGGHGVYVGEPPFSSSSARAARTVGENGFVMNAEAPARSAASRPL